MCDTVPWQNRLTENESHACRSITAIIKSTNKSIVYPSAEDHLLIALAVGL
jgi:hypothetical protein